MVKAYTDELKAAEAVAAAAGKSAEQKRRLAWEAKKYTEAEVQALETLTAQAEASEKAAEAERERVKAAEESHKSALERVRAIASEVQQLQGRSAAAVELFDLSNTGAALADVQAVAKAMEGRAVAEGAKRERELLDAAKERAEQERLVTAEREAQARAAAAGRFEELTALWQRLQTASISAPARADAERAAKDREAAELQRAIKRVQEETRDVVKDIRRAVVEASNAPAGSVARFG